MERISENIYNKTANESQTWFSVKKGDLVVIKNRPCEVYFI